MSPNTTRTTRELADGNEMPMLGVGVWQVPEGPECVSAVRWALERGYRHVDTAQAYRNESSVGTALKQSEADRNDGRIFDFELTGEEVKQLDALDRTGGTGSALENKWW